MTELDRKLEALTLQPNHVGPISSSRHCEQSEGVVDGSDAQRLFDDKVLLPHRGLPGRKYERALSRAGTLVSVAQARCNEAAADEGAATRASASTAPKAAPGFASASEQAAAPKMWKRVVVGTNAAMPIISADTRWLNLMGFSRYEIRGKSLQIVCGPKSAHSTLTQLLAKATSTPSSPAWLRLYHKSGQEICLIVRATLRIESGERCVVLEMQTLDPRAEDEDEEDTEDDSVHLPPQSEEFARAVTWGSAADVAQQSFERRDRRLLAVLADAERSFARSVEHVSSPRSPWGKSAGPSSPLARLVSSPCSSSPRSPWGESARPNALRRFACKGAFGAEYVSSSPRSPWGSRPSSPLARRRFT
jgi:hypothetical protein